MRTVSKGFYLTSYLGGIALGTLAVLVGILLRSAGSAQAGQVASIVSGALAQETSALPYAFHPHEQFVAEPG